MPFTLNAYLPSLQKEIQIKELSYKQYRELVKSLYNVDKKETIQQYNSILLDLCPDIEQIDITFEDKLYLLLTVRGYCVSPDLKLKGTGPNNNTFNFSVAIDTITKNVKSIDKSKVFTLNEITIEYSSYKVRDEHVFIGNNKDTFAVLASYIDTIKTPDQTVLFKDFSFTERLNLIESFPQSIVNQLYEDILEIEEYYEKQVLLDIKNPITKESALILTKNIDFETLQKIIGFIFTEELNNIYRAFFNIVNYAGFSPEYVDSITPVEMQVYWMYYIEDREKNNKENTVSNNGLNFSSQVNKELGF